MNAASPPDTSLDPPRDAEEVRSWRNGAWIGYLREHEIALTWDCAAAALQARAAKTAKTVTVTTR